MLQFFPSKPLSMNRKKVLWKVYTIITREFIKNVETEIENVERRVTSLRTYRRLTYRSKVEFIYFDQR